MSSERHVTTPYQQFVYSNVPKAARVGQGAYTYSELAAMVGLKPTQHFRRRINELVQRGVFKLVPAFTPRGGIENRFQFEVTMMEDFPF